MRKKPNLNTAYLSLGTNIDPETNLLAAVRLLERLTHLESISSAWETRPVGFADQPNFLNAVVMVSTDLTAPALKQNVLACIERTLGRVRLAGNKNGPRPIDLDILLFNREILQLDQTHIPDPDILVRPFLAIPLAEIAPDYQHPETGQTLGEIAARFAIDKNEMQLRQDMNRALESVFTSAKSTDSDIILGEPV